MLVGTRSSRSLNYAKRGEAARRSRYASNRARFIPRSLVNRLNYVKCKVEPTVSAIIGSTSLSVGSFAWAFQLNDMADYTNYQAVYDQYCIKQVTAYIMPCSSQQSPSASLSFAPVCTVLDYDDSTLLSTWQQALNYGNAIVHSYDAAKHVVRKIKPVCNAGLYNGTTTSFSGVCKPGDTWIDSIASNIPHYGLKAVVRQGTSTSLQQYFVYFEYIVALRNTR